MSKRFLLILLITINRMTHTAGLVNRREARLGRQTKGNGLGCGAGMFMLLLVLEPDRGGGQCGCSCSCCCCRGGGGGGSRGSRGSHLLFQFVMAGVEAEGKQRELEFVKIRHCH